MLRIIAEHEGDRSDGAGLDHGEPRPGEQQRRRLADPAMQEMILAAGVRVGRAEFGIDEGADQRDDPAGQPDGDECPFAPDIGGDYLQGAEYADADDNADQHGDAVDHAEAGARRAGLRVDGRQRQLAWCGAFQVSTRDMIARRSVRAKYGLRGGMPISRMGDEARRRASSPTRPFSQMREADQLPPGPPVTLPVIVLPSTVPEYLAPSTVKRMTLPSRRASVTGLVLEGAAENLIALRQPELLLAEPPAALDLGRDDPHERHAPSGRNPG